ncbi:MAG: type II 3-dehydroquinate dehydratase [Rickettsiales bacterium]|jgi:3-dehydroquinate dehydratase-2|nr:type II 3-dehydroquinate dehydratase [Rickettsiales bacterium]
MQRILIINGPNLNMLGSREPEIYGSQTLADLDDLCQKAASARGLEVECWQSNNEGDIITRIQKAASQYHGLIINGGGYTHTSVAIMDALLAIPIPIIEVHLSNPLRREHFRHISYIGRAAKGSICGFGADSYKYAISAMAQLLHA